MKPETVIFDMGNVILPFDPILPCRVLAEKTDKTAQECLEAIYHSKLEWRFEIGEIDSAEFTEGTNRMLGLDMTESYWQSLWSDMFEENSDVSAIVRQLKPNHRLILLSNTNPWHFAHAKETYPIISEFDDYVLSFEERAMKPQKSIYEAALRKAEGKLPTLFIDDIEANALGAEAVGITGIWFRNAEQLRTDLFKLGCEFY